MGLVPAYAQTDLLQEWKDYVKEYKAYMENYKKWVNEQITKYEKTVSDLQSQIEQLEDDNGELKEQVYELESKDTKQATANTTREKDESFGLAPFVKSGVDPQTYVDRYNNEATYKKWFDDNYSQYDSIHDAVGLGKVPEKTRQPVDKTRTWITLDKAEYQIGNTIKINGVIKPTKAPYTLANGTEVIPRDSLSWEIIHTETNTRVHGGEACIRHSQNDNMWTYTPPPLDFKKYWVDNGNFGSGKEYTQCADAYGNYSWSVTVDPDKFLYGEHIWQSTSFVSHKKINPIAFTITEHPVDNVLTYPEIMAFVEKHPNYDLESPINFGTEIEYQFVARDGSLSVTTYNDGSAPNMLYKCYDTNRSPVYSSFSFGDSLVQDIMTLC